MCASKKKKKERRKRNKKRNTKPQTKKTRPRTTGKRGMTTKYVTAPCVIHIVSTATHTWMRKPSMLRRRAPKGQHRTQKKKKKERRTATHVKRHARKHKPQPYIPHIYSSIGPDRREKKKKSSKAQKVWGGHGQRGNNEKANKRTFPNHEETTVWRASMLTIRVRAPKGRTTHTRTHINKTARSEKTETRARENKV